MRPLRIWLAIVVFAVIISGILVVTIDWPEYEAVDVTSKIVKKYTTEESGPPYIYPDGGSGILPTNPDSGMPGIPIGRDTDYYFKLANGKTIKVSRTTYNQYDVGDDYTYKKWVRVD